MAYITSSCYVCEKTLIVNNLFFSVLTMTFNPQNYTVPEGTPAHIMIVLDKPSPKDINITVTTMDITAEGTMYYLLGIDVTTPSLLYAQSFQNAILHGPSLLSHPDPDDYTGGSFTVLIPAGTVMVTVAVTTLADILVEDDEYFKATLSLPGAPEAVVFGYPNMAFVTVTDETRMLRLFSFGFMCLSEFITLCHYNVLQYYLCADESRNQHTHRHDVGNLSRDLLSLI